MDPVFTVTKGQDTATDYSKCVICQKINPHENCSKLTERGLQSFQNAAENRRDNVFLRIKQDLQSNTLFLANNPVLHRTCRSAYTHKRELDLIIEKRNSATKISSTEDEPGTSQECKRRRSDCVDFKICCFLCEKERDTKGNRTLIIVATKKREDSIHRKAKEKNDKSVLWKIMGHGDNCIDMVAADFRYHRSCMNYFTTRRPVAVSVTYSSYD